MLAICLDGWNEVSLAVNRAAGVFVALVGLVAVVRIWRSQPNSMAKRAVPRPVLLFTAFWLILLLGVLLDLLIGECEITLTPLKRTIYGAAYIWSVGGLAWIVMLGQKHSARVRKQTLDPEELAKAVVAELEARAPMDHHEVFTDEQGGS